MLLCGTKEGNNKISYSPLEIVTSKHEVTEVNFGLNVNSVEV
jgi:hypothetical protein